MRSFSLLALWIVFLCFSDVALTLPAPVKTGDKTTAKTPAKKVATPAKKVTTPPVVNKAALGSDTKKTTSGSGSKTPATGSSKDKDNKDKKTSRPSTPTNGKTPDKNTPPPNNTSPKKTTEPKLPICPPNADSPPPSRANSRASSRTSSPGANGKKKKTREFNDFDFKGLFRRDEFEFVGFHGTNGENGNLYQKAFREKGQIVVPFQFNGNDGELGGGLYITDDFVTAQSFGITSANNRKDFATKNKCSLAPGSDVGVVCKVEAKVSSTFRSTVSKMWIPVGEIARPILGLGNDPADLAKQELRIQNAGMDPKKTLRFSALDQANPGNPKIGNQIMLPPGAFTEFVIRQCLPATAKASDFGAPDFPQINYRDLTTEWNIRGDPLEQV
ncbi:hypothetical protein AAF712_013192 [Marasmius tenuissimus]|uniref:Uncharacterized protein n=1 Tax=Marasmius tenuissimus TaxID=585030 RepID=A0ABR2ZGD2_9AGAR|nr:hypothetical protein PM082_016896 [Marasmius tenuissimus]